MPYLDTCRRAGAGRRQPDLRLQPRPPGLHAQLHPGLRAAARSPARLALPHQPRAGRLRVLTVGRPVEIDYSAKPRIRTEEFNQFLFNDRRV